MCGFSSIHLTSTRRKSKSILTYVELFQRSNRQILPKRRARGDTKQALSTACFASLVFTYIPIGKQYVFTADYIFHQIFKHTVFPASLIKSVKHFLSIIILVVSDFLLFALLGFYRHKSAFPLSEYASFSLRACSESPRARLFGKICRLLR